MPDADLCELNGLRIAFRPLKDLCLAECQKTSGWLLALQKEQVSEEKLLAPIVGTASFIRARELCEVDCKAKIKEFTEGKTLTDGLQVIEDMIQVASVHAGEDNNEIEKDSLKGMATYFRDVIARAVIYVNTLDKEEHPDRRRMCRLQEQIIAFACEMKTGSGIIFQRLISHAETLVCSKTISDGNFQQLSLLATAPDAQLKCMRFVESTFVFNSDAWSQYSCIQRQISSRSVSNSNKVIVKLVLSSARFISKPDWTCEHSLLFVALVAIVGTICATAHQMLQREART